MSEHLIYLCKFYVLRVCAASSCPYFFFVLSFSRENTFLYSFLLCLVHTRCLFLFFFCFFGFCLTSPMHTSSVGKCSACARRCCWAPCASMGLNSKQYIEHNSHIYRYKYVWTWTESWSVIPGPEYTPFVLRVIMNGVRRRLYRRKVRTEKKKVDKYMCILTSHIHSYILDKTCIYRLCELPTTEECFEFIFLCFARANMYDKHGQLV